MDEFDVIVIGAGAAGENAAGRCADGGLSVAIVEHELVGGECSYWACVPSKTLLRPGDVVAQARRVPGAAAAVTGKIDVAAALARRDEATHSWDDSKAIEWEASKHIAVVRGTATIVGERRVDVEDRELLARRAVIVATGTTVAMPSITGLADVDPWTNREATSVMEVPRRLLVLGGGTVGVEMGQAFHRFGAEVTIVESGDALMTREEPFVSDELRNALAAEGIAVMLGQSMTAVARGAPGGPVRATLADGRELEADELLVAVGRRPATTDLGLHSVGLEPGEYIEVDDQLRATKVDGDWLYAIGDCNGRALLTHMGKYQGRIAGDVILGKNAHATAPVPRVTFTDPQVCAVGLTEPQARHAGIDVRIVKRPTGEVTGAWVEGDNFRGTSMLIVDEPRRTLVGATFTGPGVQELLHSATVAIAGNVTLDELWHAVPSFPTVSEVWLRLLEEYGL